MDTVRSQSGFSLGWALKVVLVVVLATAAAWVTVSVVHRQIVTTVKIYKGDKCRMEVIRQVENSVWETMYNFPDPCGTGDEAVAWLTRVMLTGPVLAAIAAAVLALWPS